MFPHQAQGILSTGARAVSPRLCTRRTSVHRLPLVRAQASPAQVAHVAICIGSASAQQHVLEEPGSALSQEAPALRLHGESMATLNEPEERGCSPTNSRGPSGRCIMNPASMQFTVVRSGHAIYAFPGIGSSYGPPLLKIKGRKKLRRSKLRGGNVCGCQTYDIHHC